MSKRSKNPEVQKELFDIVSDVYDDTTRRLGTLWGEYFKNKLYQTISRVISKNNVWLLDVGGGTGVLTKSFVGSSNYIVIADLSREMLEVAKGRGLAFLVEADAQRLSFEDSVFDLTLCVDTLHHLPGAKQVIAEMKRVTKDGGYVCVVEINNNWADFLRHRLLRLVQKRYRKKSTYGVSLYQEEIPVSKLLRMFQEVGLTHQKRFNIIFIPPLQSRRDIRILEFLEIPLEHIPIIKDISGKVCLIGRVDKTT